MKSDLDVARDTDASHNVEEEDEEDDDDEVATTTSSSTMEEDAEVDATANDDDAEELVAPDQTAPLAVIFFSIEECIVTSNFLSAATSITTVCAVSKETNAAFTADSFSLR